MKIRTLLLVAALFLASAPVASAAQSSGLPLVELGFSPSSLVPLSQGNPIYTVGDQLWLSSGYNLSLSAALYPSGSSTPVSVVPINYKSVELVYTFGPSDQSGVWSLVLVSGTLPLQVVQVYFERPPDLNPPALSSSSLLSNGTLLTNFNMSLGEGYNGEGCIVGSVTPSVVPFSFPSSDGEGEVTLTTNGSTISVLSAPLGIHTGQSNSMDFWVELYYPYSYTFSATSGAIVTRNILVARSDPVLLNSSLASNSTIELSEYSHLRTGRFDLVAYFRDSSGLTARESSVLWSGTGPWVWLGGCVGLEQLASSFYYSTPLTTPSSSWPSGIYAMLSVGGVEGAVFSSIPLNLTAIYLTTGSWGGAFPRALGVSVLDNPNVSRSAVVNGTAFLELRDLPTTVVLSVESAGSKPENISMLITHSHTDVSVPVALGRVNVIIQMNGVGVPGARISLSSTSSLAGITVAGTSNAQGSASFLLVPDNYTVAYQYRNFTGVSSVDVYKGTVSLVSVQIPQASDYTLSYALLAVGAVGVLANIFFWRRAIRRV